MIKPKILKPGEVIGVVAPSDAVEDTIRESVGIVESWGFKIKYGKHIYSRIGDFSAGSPQDRMEDLRAMIFDPEVKAIWTANGGYAATEIMPVFDKDTIGYMKQQAKWFIGYSDITLIMNALSSYGIPSVMGPTMWGLSDWDEVTRETIRKVIAEGKAPDITEKGRWRDVLPGTAVGRIVASNLETLVYSFGSRFDPLMYGRGEVILCFEDLDIEKSQLQRMIDIVLNHKRANRIKGIIIGRLTNVREKSYPKWGMKVTAEGLAADRVKGFGVPMAFCDEFGHMDSDWEGGFFDVIKKRLAYRRFIPLINGMNARLTVAASACKLEYLEGLCQETEDEPTKDPAEPVRVERGDIQTGSETNSQNSG
jgi:muramoyltetrapeptide carboxypeptidase